MVGEQVDRIVTGIAARIDGDPETARRRAISFMATCVGAMVLARSVGKKKLAREILSACHDTLTGDAPFAR